MPGNMTTPPRAIINGDNVKYKSSASSEGLGDMLENEKF
jgi:hypothetical protein